MRREVGIYLFNFNNQVNYDFPPCITLDLYIKGDLRKNGKGINQYNAIYIDYTDSLPDSHDYGERIMAMVNALGGESSILSLIAEYAPERANFYLGIPAKYSEWNEDGYINSDVLSLLSRLGVNLDIYYK